MVDKWKNYQILARDFLDAGDNKEALNAYLKAVDFAPNKEELANVYFAIADLYWQEDKRTQAAKYYRKIQRLGEYAGAEYGLGVFAQEEGDIVEAVGHFEYALMIDPDYESACYEWALLNDRIGYKDRALELFERCAELVPDNGVVYSDMASIYEERKEYKKALSLAEKAVALSPAYSIGYYNLGVIYQKTFKNEKALAAYEDALALDENYAPTYLNMSAIYLRMKAPEKAIAILTEGIEKNLNSVNLYYNRSCSHMRLGEKEAAIRDLKQAIAINPHAKLWASRDVDLKDIVREVED